MPLVSPRKAKSALSLIPEEASKMPCSTKSCESLYSNSTSISRASASMVYRKTGSQKQASFIPAKSEVRQRVLSARRLRAKTFQNQLADAQQTISDLVHENRILRTLHKRQDSALSKYESSSAELPQLLHSHAEELRVWQSKYRSLQTINKELEQKLKQKDAVILSLSDQNRYYSQLNKDKSLDERQRLTEKLHALEAQLLDKDKEMNLLTRKSEIEKRNLKKQIQNEQKKSKELVVKLEKIRLELSGYRKLDEFSINDKFLNMGLRRKDVEPQLTKDLELPAIESDFSLNNPPEEHSDYNLTSGSTKNEPQKFNFSSRTANTDHNMPNTASTTASSLQTSKTQKPILHRLHRGDGDGAVLKEMKNYNKSSKLPVKDPQPTSQKQYSGYYQDTSEMDEDETDADIGANGSNVEDLEQQLNDDGESITEDDLAEEQVEMPVQHKIHSARTKKDISDIRKQITADFKEREAFLDSFCRQATKAAFPEEPPKLNFLDKNHNVSNNRKNKLLAALKTIDDKKGVEQK